MTQPLKIIGLHGPAGSGKDTVAQMLCDTHAFRQVSLAEPIRKAIVAMFGIPIEYLIDRRLKELPIEKLGGKTGREVMISLGSEWGRKEFGPNVWIDIAQEKIDYLTKLNAAQNLFIDGIVISDIRFTGEQQWLKSQGGILWHIRRPNNPDATKIKHESEIPLIPGDNDKFLINDSSIDDLFYAVGDIMNATEVAL